jgi:hypothetical protein
MLLEPIIWRKKKVMLKKAITKYFGKQTNGQIWHRVTCSHFLKSCELIAGPYRAKINATMIAQSKKYFQAEVMHHAVIDAFTVGCDQVYGDQRRKIQMFVGIPSLGRICICCYTFCTAIAANLPVLQ